MKTQAITVLLGGMILMLAACTSTSEPDPGPAEPQASLVGVWIFENETDDGAKVYSRAAALAGNRSGYEFSEHGGLKVRTPGWCGTAPLAWSNLDGLWERVDDRLLEKERYVLDFQRGVVRFQFRQFPVQQQGLIMV